jgi:hypothetical protein
MPWRSGPRAALRANVMWVGPLMVAIGLLCASVAREPPRPRSESLSCVSVRGDRWNLLPGVEFTGRIGVQVPPGRDSNVTLVIGDALPVMIEAETADGAPLPVTTTTVPAPTAPVDFWIEYGSPWLAPQHILQASLAARDDRAQSVIVNLGRRAPRVLARLAGYPDEVRGRICAVAVDAAPAFSAGDGLQIGPGDAAYFAGGWYGLETQPSFGRVRWMTDHGALLVPSSRDGAIRARLHAMPAAAGEDDVTMVMLQVNDVFATAPVAMVPGTASYEWMIPAIAWVAGTNELLFSVSHTSPAANRRDSRAMGLALQELVLTLVPEGGSAITK